MHIGVLGPTELRRDGAQLDLGALRQRAVLAALATAPGRATSPDAVADLVWGEQPPAAVTATLQAYVARLRRVLEPDRPPRTPARVLTSEPGGYALQLPAEALDSTAFERAVTAAHEHVVTLRTPEHADASLLERTGAELAGALALWRGRPYADLADVAGVLPLRARLEDLRLVAQEDLAVIDLARGRHATVAAELEALTAQYPLRERLWGLRALALTRAGRQADALAALREVRQLLADELGLEPGPELQALQAAVLRQDASLEWVPLVVGPPATQRSAPRPTEASGPGEAPHPAPGHGAAWPIVGRDRELAALGALLERAMSGEPGLAVLTGEPGIGKSRLAAELAERARTRGARVLVGRCPQDEGAPPLWPWVAVLRELGRELPSGAATDGAAPIKDGATSRFLAWEQIAGAVREEALTEPVLLVLDDLHWADASTLRVLRLLAESLSTERLLVVATWRDQPAPTGVLAEVAELLARLHALRLELTGLDADGAGRVVGSVTRRMPTAADGAALRRRTDGNPFFLVEYARLAGERGDLAALLAEPHPPAAVQDVLSRRVAALPEVTRSTLRTAAVAGRDFAEDVVAEAGGWTLDEVLDALEPALEAGLVREVDVGHWRFAHALVRDGLDAGLSRSRAGRWHARLAEVLEGRPGQESDVARHWLAAGPAYASRAWRAALPAADVARRVYAFEEAAALLTAGVHAQDGDPAATAQERSDLLTAYAEALRSAGNWLELRPVVHRLVLLAEEIGDLDRLVHATTLSLDGALWQASQQGEVDVDMVSSLRRALDRLPPGDDPRRCRAMIGLAGELYYDAVPAEREALAAEAVAMARRLEDPALLLWSCLAAATSIWRAANAPLRFELLDEACALARGLGDRTSLSSAMTLRAAACGELGRVAEMEDAIVAARGLAETLRHHYAQLVLDALEAPWLAMRGEFERVDELLAHLVTLGQTVLLQMSDNSVAGTLAMRMLWSGEHEQLVGVLRQIEEVSPLPVQSFVAAVLARMGRLQDAREYLAEHPIDLTPDTWFSPLLWAMGAEVALHLELPDMAAAAYDRLVELAGYPASTGSAAAFGPIDAFLAMAAAATGQQELAGAHADAAVALCRTWRIPLVEEWFTAVRATHGF